MRTQRSMLYMHRTGGAITKPAAPAWNAGHSLSANMVCAYLLTEGSGTAVSDATGQLTAGTIASGSWSTDPDYGSVVVFNGTSTKIELPSLAGPLAGNEVTMLYVLKLDSNSPAATQTGIDNFSAASPNHYPWTNASVYLGQYHTTRLTIANGSFNKAAWHQFAVSTKNGAGNYKLYQNGSQINSSTAGEAALTLPAAPTFGGDISGVGGSYFFDGNLSSWFIWSRVLTGDELLAMLSDPWQMFR